MKIYLIRHGDPDYEHDTLTDRGHSEARSLVSYLRGQEIGRIYTSPMGRARDTARYTAEALGFTAAVEKWMAELTLFSDMEDRSASWDIHGHMIRNADYLAEPFDPGRVPYLPVERIEQVRNELRGHSDTFLASLGYVRDGGVYRVEQPNAERIAVFAHGGFGLTWLSLLLEIPTPLMWSGFFLHTSSVTQILFDERVEGLATPRCIMMSALPHLFAASISPGTAGIRANYT